MHATRPKALDQAPRRGWLRLGFTPMAASGPRFPPARSARPRRTRFAGVLLGLLAGTAGPSVSWAAAPATNVWGPPVLQSRSGQFIVRTLPGPGLAASPLGPTNTGWVHLDSAVLVVSCERLKQALLQALGLRDEWQGRVLVVLHPGQQAEGPLSFDCALFRDGWAYELHLPERVGRSQLITRLVELLLLEVANRRARAGCVELPPWLVEGLAAHLEATSLATLTLEPESRLALARRYPDPLRRAREILRTQPLLSFDELSWPPDPQASVEQRETYRSCAHLFVYQLLRLKRGRQCLQQFLAVLPEHLNWQTAFLRSFQPYFSRLLDVDKWWTLQAVSVMGRNLVSTWSPEEAWRQVEATLRPPAREWTRTNALPRLTRVRLQTVISQWEFPRQLAVLVPTLNRLKALRPRVGPDLARLLGEYIQTLEDYLAQRNRPRGPDRLRNPLPPNPRLAAAQTVERLDELDLQRARLRPEPDKRAEAIEQALAESRRRQLPPPEPAPSAPRPKP